MKKDFWDIFDNNDGIIIQQCYGRENAILQAKGIAQRLKTEIGIWSNGEKQQIFRPVVSLGWVPKENYYCEKCGTKQDNTWLDDGYTCPNCKHVN